MNETQTLTLLDKVGKEIKEEFGFSNCSLVPNEGLKHSFLILAGRMVGGGSLDSSFILIFEDKLTGEGNQYAFRFSFFQPSQLFKNDQPYVLVYALFTKYGKPLRIAKVIEHIVIDDVSGLKEKLKRTVKEYLVSNLH